MTGSACRARALKPRLLGEEDAATRDLDLLLGQRLRGRSPHNGTGRDVVLAAVARAVDRPVADLVDDAPHVGADRAERLELAGRGLGDDYLLPGEDHSAADGDLAGRDQCVARRSA